MQAIADHFRSSVPCVHSDALLDDLSFWDAMRGYDCLDDQSPTFIRVYAHAASVPQTLQDWADTLDESRSVARGANWYVIGPQASLAAIEAPAGQPQLATDVGSPLPMTAEHDYLTTCALFIDSEGKRYVRESHSQDESVLQYEALFPGVADQLHSAIDELDLERVRSIQDTERWSAALSSVGPRVKRQCEVAFREVGDRVQPLEGN